MSRLRYLGTRLVGLAVSVWAVFTLAFVYTVLTPYNEMLLRSDRVPTSPDDPLFRQYLDWLGWFLTIWDEPLVAQVAESFLYTAVYLVPAVTLAVAIGTAIRLYTVASEGNLLDRLTDGVTILAVSIPVFLLAYLLRRWFLTHYFSLLDVVRIYSPTAGAFSVRNLLAAVWPATVMTVYLLAIQLRYAGETLREYAAADFVKTARAKGVSTWRVGRHIFGNTAIPLLTIFFTDMLGMVVIGVFVVEFVTHAPGLGDLTIQALLNDNLPLLLGLSVLLVLVGVVANLAQDVAYLLYDPRVSLED